MHRLTDQVLAQHRADRGLAVTAARERRATRALQVQVATASVDVEHLTQQERPPVAEAGRIAAELVAGVGLRHRRRSVGRRVADEERHPVGCSQRIGIHTQLGRQLLVERQQPGRGRDRRLPRLVQTAQVANEGVVELEQGSDRDAHSLQANGRRRGASTLTTVTDLRNPHVGEPFTDADTAIAAALEDVSVPVLLCSLVHMTGDPSWIRERPLRSMPNAADLHGGLDEEERADIRGRAVPAIAAYRDGGCIPHDLSRDVLVEMMAFLAGKPLEGIMVPMFLEDMQFDGADSDAISWGDEVSDEAKAASPVVVIGAGLSGILAGIRLSQAGLPFVIVEKDAGPGGTWWRTRTRVRGVDRREPSLLLRVRSVASLDRVLLPAARAARLLHQRARQVRAASALPLQHRGDVAHVGRTDELLAGGHSEPRRERGSARGAVRDQRGRFAEHPRLPDIPGMDAFDGPSFHSARWPEGLDIAGTRFALVGTGASGFQIAPTIADQVEQLTIFQRTTQWMLPNPLYHAKVPPGDRWAMLHLPFYARWFRFVMLYPGIAMGTEQYRVDPDFHATEGVSVNETNDRGAGS